MQKDSKTVIIWVLAIIIVILGVLYIRQMKEVDSLRSLSDTVAEMRAELITECANTGTEEGREKCADALKSLSSEVSDIKDEDTKK